MNYSNFDVKVLFMLLLTAAVADGQSFHLGKCQQPSVQEDFDVTRYMGTWYEIEKLPAIFERGKCNQATYRLNCPVVFVKTMPNGKINSIEGVAKVKNSSQPAILTVSFFKGKYTVHTTSHILWCTLVFDLFGLFHVDYAWILARTRVLTEDVISQLHDELASAGVNLNRLTVSDQTGCDQTKGMK
uniref:Apolipoprotein D n=1 Tax=Sander lucioperca TaxID=283035 RepID=A0A8C9XXF2_SANLU